MKLDVIYNEDCLEGMQKVPKHSIDLVVTDPPYSTPVMAAYGRKREGSYGDLSVQKHFLMQVKSNLERILKSQAAVFIFCNAGSYPVLFEVFYNWQTNRLLIWDKMRIGFGSPFRKQYELIYFLSPDSALHFKNGKSYSDILQYKPVSSQDRLIGAQKPLELIQELIEAFTEKDSIVFDPFMGSGTTAIACKQLGRYYIGFEINSDHYEIAKRRLEDERTLWDK